MPQSNPPRALRLHKSLSADPRISRSARSLGVSRYRMLCMLLDLWLWCAQYLPADGSVGDFPLECFADIARFDRGKERFIDALVEGGFLTLDPPRVHMIERFVSIEPAPRVAGLRRHIPALLNRRGQWCEICGDTLPDDCSEIHVDHIIPVSKGGDHRLSNLRLAHGACNIARGNRV